MRKYAIIIVLLAVSLWAMYLKQQTYAVISLILCVAATYESQTRRIIVLFERIAVSAKSAKFGDLEVELDKRVEQITKLVAAKSAWINIATNQLEHDAITLLLGISKTGNYEITNALKPKLRSLRDHGLISHNEDTIERSTFVSTTQLGQDLAEILLSADIPIPAAQSTESKKEKGD